ncbi:MAG: hypothetical protein KDD70_14635, partial [Bdellovibrionales bacterium]|nr:hypothetical protein [Bdellovibrionales bacterium]
MSKAEIAPEAKFWNIIVYTVLFLALSACGSVDFSGPKRDTLIKNPNDVSGVPTGLTGLGQGDGDVTTLRAPEFPWQMWSSERDLAGQPITNVLILEGDHLFNQSRFVDALSRFQEAKSTAVTKSEQDAIIIREAGTRLALGNAEGTLRVLSNYFRRSGRAEESVTAPFSLLFAYSYGSRGDVEQALAWFSRTNRLHAGSGGYGEAAGNGVRALLRVPTTEEIHALGERWKTDSFVSLLIGQELRR